MWSIRRITKWLTFWTADTHDVADGGVLVYHVLQDEAEVLLQPLHARQRGPHRPLPQHRRAAEERWLVTLAGSLQTTSQLPRCHILQKIIQILNKFQTNFTKIQIFCTKKNHFIIRLFQGLLYHRTCKRDFPCSWPSLNSYLK